MGSPALEVDECGTSSGFGAPRASDRFHPMAALPPRRQRKARKQVLAANEVVLYTNLHIAIQRILQLLERGDKPAEAAAALGATTEDPVTTDSFTRVRSYMSGSVPQSFHSALDRAWPAKEGYGAHPSWWTDHFPKRAKYSLPSSLFGALKAADSGTAGLIAALQQYYSSAAGGIQAEQQERLSQSKSSLERSTEMVRSRDPQIRARVDAIAVDTLQLLDWTVSRAPCHEFEIAVRIATDYLPHTLQSYLDVPAEQMPIRTGGGKSARDLTLEQLDLIGKAVEDASDNHATVEASKLLANQRFLEDRFGGSSLDLPK